MTEPLTTAELVRMRAEHVEGPDGNCLICCTEPYWGEVRRASFPCDAALLLAEIERMWWAGFDGYVGPLNEYLPKEFQR